jgi:2',3'-cyclic-nucleotide 2'-phosphodiesterase (5'-nucleotidase family)
MRTKRVIPIIMIITMMLSPLVFQTSSYKSGRLVFLLTTDIHSQIYSSADNGDLVGGLAVLSGVVQELRKSYGSDAVVWIDRGDAIIGDPVVDMHYGIPVIEAFNIMGLDVMVIDNHELDLGLENFFKMYKYAEFPMITSNVFYRNGTPILPRYVVIERVGIRIGITGATTPSPNIIHSDLTNKTSTLSELPNLEESVARLTSLGVDMIVVITHGSINSIRSIVEKYPLVKLVYKVGSDIVEDNGVLYVGGGGSSRSAVVATFEVTADGIEPLSDESFVIDVRSPPYPVDPRIVELADYYRSPLNFFLETPVVYLDTNLKRDELCVMMAQAMRNITGSDFGIYNKGGVRNLLKRGLVTRYDVYKVYPWWQEGIYVVNVPGWYIKNIAQNSAYSVYPSDGIDSLIDDQYYSVAITEYHFIGGDGLKFREYSVNSTYIDIPYAEAFISIYSGENATGYQILMAELNKVRREYEEMTMKAASLKVQLSSEREWSELLSKERIRLENDMSIASWYNDIYKVIISLETFIILLTIIYLFKLRKRGC